jgi:hypothetical protein|tara:strand:+ start:23666 stop:24370 length:705 start_codon:yes stop_codon:yes gene_type:complete
MKLSLKNIDLISINCTNPEGSAAALNYCQKDIDFGRSILLTHQDSIFPKIETRQIPRLSWEKYNDRCLGLLEEIDNEYALVVQEDGYITNPRLWEDDFLNYDYIGAPWPHEDDWVKLQREDVQHHIRENFPLNRVGNGGFSLRSRKFLEFSNQFDTCGGFGEDAFLCTINYQKAVDYGIKFAPLDVAFKFAYENPCTELGNHWNDRIEFNINNHFGWHGKVFNNSDFLLNLKYN